MRKELLAKLGCNESDRLVIINGDDFGMCHSANTGTIKFLTDFPGNSATIMMPCPWANEALQFWRDHPDASIGIECTLTSEWQNYRWGPLSPKSKVPSLVDPDGFLWGNTDLLKEHAKADEVELEVRTQIDRAIKQNLQPSHLTNHMFAMHCRPDLMDLYVKLVKEYRLPARIRRLQDDPGWPSIDGMIAGETYSMGPHGREQRLYEILRDLKPGMWELYPHFNDDCDEARAIMSYSKFVPEDVNSWRGRDNDIEIYTGARVQEVLKELNIKRISWKQIRDCIRRSF
jgi:predicted glycoside hydrolase/deacetylase ChbG (UPF0249 family)